MLGYDFKNACKGTKKDIIQQLPAFQCKKNAVYLFVLAYICIFHV